MKKFFVSMILILFMLEGCSSNFNLDKNVKSLNVSVTGEESTELVMPDVQSIRVKNQTGSIKINKTNGQKIKLRLLKRAEGKEEQDVRNVLNEAQLYTYVNAGSLEVSVVRRGDKSDFWAWKSGKYSNINAGMEFYVDIPKDFESYIVNNQTGDICLESLEGCISVENTTGNISIQNTVLEGRNYISLVTGNIDLDTNIDKSEDLELISTTGNINLTVPSHSKFSLEAGVTTGMIGGTFEGMSPERVGTGGISVSKELNGGGKEVAVHTITGNVYINSK